MFKNLYECLERNDLIPVVANVIFFMIVQILFFKYVASKQLDEILLEKLDFVNELQKHSSYVKSLIQNYKEETLKKNKDAFLIQEKKNKEENWELSKQYLSAPIIIIILMMLHLVFIMNSKRTWNDTDSIALIFVTLAYCTELIFFFFIVRKYEFIGDNYIISKVLESILKD